MKPLTPKAALAFVEAGDIKKLGAELKRDPGLAKNPALLNAAALHGQTEAAELLLDEGADPNGEVPSHEHYRPLHRAIEHRGVPKNPGHLPTIKALLDRGADLTLRGTWMQLPPLAVAGMAGDHEILDAVLAHKPPMDIFTASITADSKKVDALLKKTSSLATTSDTNAMTPLHYAALSGFRCGHAEKALQKIVLRLLELGADPNASPTIGPYPSTPVLHFAGWGNNLAVARVLLEKGANPNLGFGNTLWREPGELAELFVKHGADVNGCDKPGAPYFHTRVHWNLPKVCLWLIERGLDPNLRDADGNTPLHAAARKGINPKVIETLLARGADRKATNRAGETALDLAKKLKKSKAVEALK